VVSAALPAAAAYQTFVAWRDDAQFVLVKFWTPKATVPGAPGAASAPPQWS